MTRIAIALGLLAPLYAAAGTNDNALAADRTGLRWEQPFERALAKAKEQTRLLLIKPVAFGTTPDGGW